MAKRTGAYYSWGKTYKAFSQALLQSGKALNSIATVELQEVADKFLDRTNAEWPHHSSRTRIKWGPNNVSTAQFGGDAMHPWFSGQLHDSVAVRIAQGNRTTSVHYMPPSANGGPQHMGNTKGIIGVEWAREVAERRAPYFFLPGVQVELIVGVPYTDKVNESGRHYGFADNLANELFNDVWAWIDGGGLNRWTLKADNKGVRVEKTPNIRTKRK